MRSFSKIRLHGLQQFQLTSTLRAFQQMRLKLIHLCRVETVAEVFLSQIFAVDRLTVHYSPNLYSGPKPYFCDSPPNFFAIFLTSRDLRARTASCDIFKRSATSASECPSTSENSRICWSKAL